MKDKKSKTPELVILGLENSGKSSVINRLLFGTVNDSYPHQNICLMNIGYGNSTISVIEADEEIVRENAYFQDVLSSVDGILFVVDTTTQKHVEASFEYLYGILGKIPENISILILANKMDLKNAVPLEDVLGDPAFSIIADQSSRSIAVHQVSIKTGENFYLAIDWLVSRMTQRTPLHEEVTIKRVIILQEGGVPVFDYTFDTQIKEHDDTLLGGLIHALNIMASTIFESDSVMDVIKLGDFKFILRKIDNYTVVLFVGRDDIEFKAQTIAEEILRAYMEEKTSSDQVDLSNEEKHGILSKIPEIAILLDHSVKL